MIKPKPKWSRQGELISGKRMLAFLYSSRLPFPKGEIRVMLCAPSSRTRLPGGFHTQQEAKRAAEKALGIEL